MPSLTAIALRNLASRRLPTALAVIAVVLGTSVVAAAFTTNAAVEAALLASARALVGEADLVVEAVDDSGFSPGALAAVQALPEVAVVAPQVHKRTFFRSRDQRGFVQLLGIDRALDPQVHGYRIADGRMFEPNERAVLLVKDWAAKVGLRVGDSLDLVTGQGFEQFVVAGLLDEPDLSQRNYGGLVRVPMAVAQSSFGLGDRLHSLSIKLRAPSPSEREGGGEGSVQALAGSLEAAIPTRFLVRETRRLYEDLLGSIREFQVNLVFFSGIALLAGAFLVLNTLSLNVLGHLREIGLLRAAGATGGAIARMTMVQGLVIGLVGSLLGVVAGQGLAVGLITFIGAIQGLPGAEISVSWPGLVASIVLGVGVTLVASVGPAVQAGRVPTVAALAEGLPSSPRQRRGRLAIAIAALASLGVFLLLPSDAPELRTVKVVGLLALFLLAVYVSREAVPSLAALVAWPLRAGLGRTIVLAERNLRGHGGRASLTAAGLIVSLSLIVALANGAASFTAAGGEATQSLFPGDFVVVSPVDQPLALVAEFRSLEGVETATPVSMLDVTWGGRRVAAAVVDPVDYFDAFLFDEGDRTQAFRDMRRGASLLVPARLAQAEGLRVGDNLRMTLGGRDVDFVVAGVIRRSLPAADNYGAFIFPRPEVERIQRLDAFRFLVVRSRPGADERRIEADVAATAEALGMESNPVRALRESVGSGVGGLVGLLTGLVVIGALVGTLSVVNTMLMNVSQRVHTIGVLRAEGLTRSQVLRVTMAEGLLIGLVGSLLGLALGAFLTWALVGLNRSVDFDPQFVFSLPLALSVVAFGVVSAGGAASYPAHLAAKTSIVDAIRF